MAWYDFLVKFEERLLDGNSDNIALTCDNPECGTYLVASPVFYDEKEGSVYHKKCAEQTSLSIKEIGLDGSHIMESRRISIDEAERLFREGKLKQT